jgi:hypothetical protein
MIATMDVANRMINKTNAMLSFSCAPAINSITAQQPVITTTTPLQQQPATGTTYQVQQVQQAILQQIQQQMQQQHQKQHHLLGKLQEQQTKIDIELINRATIINDDEKIHIDKLLDEALRQEQN